MLLYCRFPGGLREAFQGGFFFSFLLPCAYAGGTLANIFMLFRFTTYIFLCDTLNQCKSAGRWILLVDLPGFHTFFILHSIAFLANNQF